MSHCAVLHPNGSLSAIPAATVVARKTKLVFVVDYDPTLPAHDQRTIAVVDGVRLPLRRKGVIMFDQGKGAYGVGDECSRNDVLTVAYGVVRIAPFDFVAHMDGLFFAPASDARLLPVASTSAHDDLVFLASDALRAVPYASPAEIDAAAIVRGAIDAAASATRALLRPTTAADDVEDRASVATTKPSECVFVEAEVVLPGEDCGDAEEVESFVVVERASADRAKPDRQRDQRRWYDANVRNPRRARRISKDSVCKHCSFVWRPSHGVSYVDVENRKQRCKRGEKACIKWTL